MPFLVHLPIKHNSFSKTEAIHNQALITLYAHRSSWSIMSTCVWWAAYSQDFSILWNSVKLLKIPHRENKTIFITFLPPFEHSDYMRTQRRRALEKSISVYLVTGAEGTVMYSSQSNCITKSPFKIDFNYFKSTWCFPSTKLDAVQLYQVLDKCQWN